MWSCKRCTVQNAPEATECKVCYLPCSSETEPDEWWQCCFCCQFSAAGLRVCSVCGVPARASFGMGVNGGIVGSGQPGQAGKHVLERREWAEGGGDDPGAEGQETVWVCKNKHQSSVCDTNNQLDNYRCSQCNSVKPYLPHLLTLSQVSRDSVHSSGSDHTKGDDSSGLQDEAEKHQAAAPCLASAPVNTDVARVEEALVGGSAKAEAEAAAIAAAEAAAIAAAEAAASFQKLDLKYVPQEEDELEEEVLEFPDSECRIVLVGKTGHGKSATANTILGLEKRFASSFQFGSVTKKCQRHNRVRFGIPVEVVDTPGLIDTDKDNEILATEVSKCLGIVAPGPHAILLVLRLGVRFTEEEHKAVQEAYRLFGMHLFRFVVVAFTHGDQLQGHGGQEKDRTMKDLLDSAPAKLKELIAQTKNRYVVFDNSASMTSKRQQVKRLLTTIRELLKVNDGRPFTNDLLMKVERCMNKREGELEGELEGLIGKKGKSRGREHRFFRDIVREEVVQEKPLLKLIKKQVLPVLLNVVAVVAWLLVKVFFRV